MSRILDFAPLDLLAPESAQRSAEPDNLSNFSNFSWHVFKNNPAGVSVNPKNVPAKVAKAAKEAQRDRCKNRVQDSLTLPEPASDDPDGAWHRYFDDQLRVIREDGFKWPKAKRLSAEKRREIKFIREYLAEIIPFPGAPAAPCSCGDRVFWRVPRQTSWQCRTCLPPPVVTRAGYFQWFVCRNRAPVQRRASGAPVQVNSAPDEARHDPHLKPETKMRISDAFPSRYLRAADIKTAVV
jgi:hypothetical protein